MRELSNSEVRQYQLMIMDEVHRFCKANHFTYFLVGGTLLGAIRHSGYIPWDDDIDIMMYRDEYEHFIDAFNVVHSDYYAFTAKNIPGYNYHFCKISCQNTRLIEENISICEVPIGINIDLFPLDKLPDGINEKAILNRLHLWDKLMYGKAFSWSGLASKSFKQRILIVFLKLIGMCTTKRKLERLQESLAKQYENTDAIGYSIITCHMRNQFPRLNRDATISQIHIFEGREYYIPSAFDEWLTSQFGNYMKLPPEDQRVTHHSFRAYRI